MWGGFILRARCAFLSKFCLRFWSPQHYAEDGGETTKAMLCGRYVVHRDDAAGDARADIRGEGVLVASTHQLLLFSLKRGDKDDELDFKPALVRPWADFSRLQLGPGWATFSVVFRDGVFDFVPDQAAATDNFFSTVAHISLCARKPLVLTDATLCDRYLSAIEEAEEAAGEQLLTRKPADTASGRRRSSAGQTTVRSLADCSAVRERTRAEERAKGILFLGALQGEEPPLSPKGPIVIYEPGLRRTSSGPGALHRKDSRRQKSSEVSDKQCSHYKSA